MNRNLFLITLTALSLAGYAYAQSPAAKGIATSGMPVPECLDPKNRHTPLCKDMERDMQEKVVLHNASGIVKTIDRANGTVTIALGPVESLHWQPRTVAFQVRNKKLFAKLKVARKIGLEFTQQGGANVITAVQRRFKPSAIRVNSGKQNGQAGIVQ